MRAAATQVKLSVIVIVYDMPRQALNTLYSLSAQYQWNANAADYEVIVIENRSKNNLVADDVYALGENFRYFLRDEPGVSPVGAINFGFAQVRGEFIGLMIDGARMVTPRIIEYALMGLAMDPASLVIAPGYNLGPQEHHYNETAGYSTEVEKKLLDDVGWQEQGYRLFDIASIGGANPNGFFHPLMESNCLFVAAQTFADLGGANENFQLPGGGAVNLHIYRQLGMLPKTRLVILAGEGSFHQFHGGVTTSETQERELILKRQHEQLKELWGGEFHCLSREPQILGAVTSHAQPFMLYSSQLAMRRFKRLEGARQDPWSDEPHLFIL